MLKGEFIEPAAARKLKQETGLDAQFKLIGCERRIMYKSGELFSDLMFPIAYSDKVEGRLESHTNFGDNMWVPIDQALKNDAEVFDSIKSITTVLKAIKNGSIAALPFFFEETIQSDEITAE